MPTRTDCLSSPAIRVVFVACIAACDAVVRLTFWHVTYWKRPAWTAPALSNLTLQGSVCFIRQVMQLGMLVVVADALAKVAQDRQHHGRLDGRQCSP